MIRMLIAVAGVAIAVSACGGSAERVVVAAGTTLVDSKFVERLLAEYETDAQVSVVASSSRGAFALGDQGAADLLITHLPEAEDAYIARHPHSMQEPVFRSRYIVVGAPGQTVIAAGSDIVDGFAAVARTGATFVSRADGSGTAARESAIWVLAGVEPDGQPWYIETGQGMGFTLQVTDQRGAFTLVEGGTFFADASILSLQEVPVIADPDTLLDNPYRVTLVDPAQGSARTELFEWLVSEEGREAMIRANLELYGRIIYEPSS